MSEEQAVSGPLPVVNWLKGANTDDPFIEGHKCGECGAVFLGERSTCSACSARDKISTVRLSTKGKLYSYCIVHRSFPGIEVPYISKRPMIVNSSSSVKSSGEMLHSLRNHFLIISSHPMKYRFPYLA